VAESTDKGAAPLVRRDGAYIVTGGLGGVGLQITRWLAAAGAARVVLAGRSVPNALVTGQIAEIRDEHTEVIIEQADVARREDVARIVERAEQGGYALRGIVHAAGVLDDGVVIQQTPERLARVFAPKVRGSWNMLVAGRDKPLDFLVFCSAGAALFGAPGQGNYAAANSFMDVLAPYARGLGVPAVSIDWGAWRDTGMTVRVSQRDRERWAQSGMRQLDPAQAITALERVLRLDVAQAAVLDVDWSLAAASATIGAQPLVSQLVRRPETALPSSPAAGASRSSIRRGLEQLPAIEQEEFLAAHVLEQVRSVLGLPRDTVVRGDRGFTELGMDSLMAVELSNRLRVSLECPLPTTLAFEHPTLEQLVSHLFSNIGLADRSRARPEAARPDPEATRDGVAQTMSADEASAALLAELDEIGY
jgi:NAD(P)-dependent dehydrogenase (short-subunit alcohol dehydrogenase family)/acyl carrier protein